MQGNGARLQRQTPSPERKVFMPDTTPTLDPAVQAVAQDALDAVKIGQAVAAAMKAQGATGALSQIGPVVTAVQKDYSDITAALPALKAGIRTTEFYVGLAPFLVNGLYFAFAHKTLPLDLNLVFGAVAAVYVFARSMVKSSAQAATASVAVAASLKK
jgi:hypothetical protein